MATATLLVNGDGTKGSWTDNGGGTSNLYTNINTGLTSPNDSTLIKCSATNNAIYFDLENMPSGFSHMDVSIVVKIRARRDTSKGDFRGLGACGIVASDETTALTNTSTPSVTTTLADYTLNLTIVAPYYNRNTWNGARLKIQTNAGTTGAVEVTEVQVDIAYVAASPWVFLESTQKVAAGGVNSTTTVGIDTTGADFIVVLASLFSNSAASITDSKSNSWSSHTAYNGGSQAGVRFFSCKPTSVGSAHTFTVSCTGGFTCVHVLVFSGAKASSPFDVENGTATQTNATSRQPGSITPNENNELIVAGLVTGATTSAWSINSSFLLINATTWVTGSTMGGAIAILIQTSAAAINPTYSWTGNSGNRANIASFKQEPVAAGGHPAARRFGLARQFDGVRDIGHKGTTIIQPRKELLLPPPRKLITVA